MTARKPVATGGCQCGAVRYAFYKPLEKVHACHCRMCQRATGGLFAVLAGSKLENFEWTRGTPAFFASSNLAQRGFCARCGTPLTFRYDLPEARIYTTVGSLDRPGDAPITIHFGIEGKVPWVKFCEDVPAEITGKTPEEQAFLAKMENHQSNS